MGWGVVLASRAKKDLRKVPASEQKRVKAALRELGKDPFLGDVRPIAGEPHIFRKRVGHWRILFELLETHRVVVVASIKRRTSTTY